MSDPLILPLVALAAGIVLARSISFGVQELIAITAAFAALAVLSRWKSTRRMALACVLFAFVSGGALVAIAHRPGPAPELDAAPREVVILSGCVVEPPVFSPDRERFLLELAPGARAQVSLYPKEGAPLPALHYGQKVELEARVRRTRNFRNPGAFDYAGYLARRDIYWTASAVSGAPVKTLAGDCGTPFWRFVFGLRVAALERLEELYRGDSYRTAMMQGMLVGESSGLEKTWTEDFRRTGTFHALVISGLHISVLAFVLLFLMRICFVPQGASLIVTTLVGWTYALVSGWQAPVVRGAAGFTFFVLARYFYRRPRVLNLLAAVAIGFLLFDPEQMFEASFQLSFLSVAAIGALAAPWIERTSKPYFSALRYLTNADRDVRLEPKAAHFRLELRLLAETLWLWTRVPKRFWLIVIGYGMRVVLYAYDTLVVSTTIQAGLALPMAIYFHRLSITGLSANIFIVPLLSAAVPVGFFAIFSNVKLAAALGGLLLTSSQWIAHWHVQWEPDWRMPGPPLWVAIGLTVSLIAVAIFRSHRIPAFCALASTAAMLALVILHPFAPQVERGTMEMTAMDVGQGDSLLLAFPDGKLVVLDGGGFPAFGRKRRPRLDIGEDVVSPYLWSRSIRRLDAVAISHAHEDHSGGIAALIRNFHPKVLWVGAVGESPEWTALRAVAQQHGVTIVPLHQGESFPYGGAQVEVLAPLPGYEAGPVARNNDSLVLRLSYGRHAFLLTGDIDRNMESAILATSALKPADVLKVPHHGSRSSSSDPFLDAVAPAFGVIPVGFENSYNLPSADTIRRLDAHHTVTLRTDLWGLVSLRTDGRRFHMETARWDETSGPYAAY